MKHILWNLSADVSARSFASLRLIITISEVLKWHNIILRLFAEDNNHKAWDVSLSQVGTALPAVIQLQVGPAKMGALNNTTHSPMPNK